MAMRADGNPLDLNNLPDDNNSTDAKQLPSHPIPSSPPVTGYKEKESGEDDDNDDDRKDGKVYECRFCSLKFCKSQALGGHMNRHRQEKETEKLNNARQLLLRNDHNLVAQAALHLGCYPPMPLRLPTTGSSSSTSPQQPIQQYWYASPSRPISTFPPHLHLPPQMNDYRVMMSNNNQQYVAGEGAESSSSYTCIGAPVLGQTSSFPDSTNRFQNHHHNL